MSRMAWIAQRAARARTVIGSTVTLRWTVFSGTPTTDPVTGSTLGTATESTETIKALVHYVTATMVERQNVEIEVGDVIIDLDPALVLDTRKNLRFEIDGMLYRQKTVGDRLAHYQDVLVSDIKTHRTIVLSPAR